MRPEEILRERQFKEELREFARQQGRNILQFTRFTKTNDLGTSDAVHGHRQEGVTHQDYDFQVRRYQHYGFHSRPPAGTLAIKANVGRAPNAVVIAEADDRFVPSGSNDGDVLLYNKQNGVKILLNGSDGSVLITDKNGNQIKADGSGTIQIVAGTVNVGAAAGLQPAVLGNNLETRLAALEAAHNAHTHLPGTFVAGSNAVTGTSGAVSSGTVASPGGNVRSSKVNVAP